MEIIELSKRHIVFVDKEIFGGKYDLNIHLIIAEHKTYLVDTGVGSLHMKIIEEYMCENQLNKPLIIINTHSHGDHYLGNDYLGCEYIVAHNKVVLDMELNWEADSKVSPPEYGDNQLKLPNLIFDSELYFREDGIRLIHIPGHSEGDICVYDEIEKVINMGDMVGDTQDEIVPYLNLDKDTFVQSINKVQELDIVHVICGHNSILKKDVFERMIIEVHAK